MQVMTRKNGLKNTQSQKTKNKKKPCASQSSPPKVFVGTMYKYIVEMPHIAGSGA